MEGTITDASSNTSLSGVTVEILNSNNNTISNVGGEFKLGTLNSGTYSVVFSHPLYQSDTINQVVLQNDSTTILNLVMYSLTPLNLNIESKSSVLNSSISELILLLPMKTLHTAELQTKMVYSP